MFFRWWPGPPNAIPTKVARVGSVCRRRLLALRLLHDEPPVVLGEPIQMVYLAALWAQTRLPTAVCGDRLAVCDLAGPAAVARFFRLSPPSIALLFR
jgi:hypothetical protein